MRNYYYNAGESMFSIDLEGDFPQVDRTETGTNIDRIYRIREDGILKAKDSKGNITEYEVKENDVLLIMYSNTDDWYNRQIIIIRDDRFVKYFEDLDKFKEKMKNDDSDVCECNRCCKTKISM